MAEDDMTGIDPSRRTTSRMPSRPPRRSPATETSDSTGPMPARLTAAIATGNDAARAQTRSDRGRRPESIVQIRSSDLAATEARPASVRAAEARLKA